MLSLLLLLSAASATEACPDAAAALRVLAAPEAVTPADVEPEVRVIVGSMMARRGDAEAAIEWVPVPADHPAVGQASLVLARVHRSQMKRKSAVLAAREALRLKASTWLARDAGLLLVADVYFEDLHRYDVVADYYAALADSPDLRSTAVGRRAVSMWATGHAARARKALRSLPDWKTDPDADLIWARYVTGQTTQEDALVALADQRERLAAIHTVAQARAVGATAALVALAPDAVALECLVEAHPDDVVLVAQHTEAVQGEVALLLRRVDLAAEAIRSGLPKD